MRNSLRLEIEKIINGLMASHDEDSVEESVEDYFEFIDSIRFIELVTTIEKQYGIEFSVADLMENDAKKLDGFVGMVEKYVN